MVPKQRSDAPQRLALLRLGTSVCALAVAAGGLWAADLSARTRDWSTGAIAVSCDGAFGRAMRINSHTRAGGSVSILANDEGGNAASGWEVTRGPQRGAATVAVCAADGLPCIIAAEGQVGMREIEGGKSMVGFTVKLTTGRAVEGHFVVDRQGVEQTACS